ncbi:MAG: HD domain-containing protein, partial [Treponema sp.]|nr:HD domain-containing protein [Treponema sp.]
ELLKEDQQKMNIIFTQTAEALSSAIDAKDKYTHGHSKRVAKYSKQIAQLAGKSESECQEIYFAALLHDVGKIGVADAIINKTDVLTNDEFTEIKKHPVIGKDILSHINKSPYIGVGAKYHHERFDGNGYPEGLSGKNIPEIARIIAIADSYDAMTSNRSYRKALPQEKVRREILKGIGRQFDPEFATIMLNMIDSDKDYTMKE